MLAAGHVATSARAAGRGQPGVIAVGLGSGHRNFDLWLMSPSGVKVRRLTKAPGIDTAPTWAPDGSRLAYLCRWEDDSANASGLGGALGGAIDFGPLGHHRNNGGTLCLVRPNGSGEGVLVKG